MTSRSPETCNTDRTLPLNPVSTQRSRLVLFGRALPVIAALSLLAPPVVLSQTLVAAETRQGAPQRGNPEERLKLSPAQAKELFTARQAMERRGIQVRQEILQKTRPCIDQAQNLQALGACKRSQRQAYASLMEKERQEMRDLLQKMGISVPERPAGPARRHQGKPAS
ncbi:hypothetical protein VB716_12645 [Synechococcus sp. CCY9201]|jgi:hypothetical protein|uniref:hypothetical protein n=1 Tax=unclassified Synechococcus TaxID=2626047 RepID=UPI0018CC8ADE|nr:MULTISPECIES: hypothetical protein [unclassified Synechococcus]MEA5475069.1 hypothetical protein [Synechococcus sp. CCY9201]QPN67791.1 hypothetical protein H8F26_06550 [Synechococcus sp. CBW1006]CAK6688760.1 hypothetical protein IFHNHDMJ_00472 [Synechococcus sp. CBW1107]